MVSFNRIFKLSQWHSILSAALLVSALPTGVQAITRTLSEGIPSTNKEFLVSTTTRRVDIATTTYSWGVANVGLHVASNVVVDSLSAHNACVIYATGSISCLGATLSPASSVCTLGAGTKSVNCFGNGSQSNGIDSTLSGGNNNVASGDQSTVGGGNGNNASGAQSTISGGASNGASGIKATIAGGDSNQANGDWAFAAGRNARANSQGAFVWADSQASNYTAPNTDTFNVRAQNGSFFSNSLTVAGTDTHPALSFDTFGDAATGAAINLSFTSVYAKSMDGVTQSSGCVGAIAVGASAEANATFIWSSTTTQPVTYGIQPAVLLESCAPTAVCRFGLSGMFRVQSAGALSGGIPIIFSVTRCKVTDTGSASQSTDIGANLTGATGGAGFVWIALRPMD